MLNFVQDKSFYISLTRDEYNSNQPNQCAHTQALPRIKMPTMQGPYNWCKAHGTRIYDPRLNAIVIYADTVWKIFAFHFIGEEQGCHTDGNDILVFAMAENMTAALQMHTHIESKLRQRATIMGDISTHPNIRQVGVSDFPLAVTATFSMVPTCCNGYSRIHVQPNTNEEEAITGCGEDEQKIVCEYYPTMDSLKRVLHDNWFIHTLNPFDKYDYDSDDDHDSDDDGYCNEYCDIEHVHDYKYNHYSDYDDSERENENENENDGNSNG
jgi:hypothetical protein